MTIYEIDAAITALADEYGDIADFETFDALMMQRNEKIENVALWIKNLVAEAKAIKEEEDRLRKRRQAAETKIENLKGYLDHALQGAKFETARCAISNRKSKSIATDPDFVAWAIANRDDLLLFKAPEPCKTAIKEALACGEKLPHVEVRETNNIIIK